MRDDSLLKLEKKLDTYSTKDILLSKFVLKPKIDRSEIMQGKDFLKNLGSFVSEFKKQNSELLNDENKAKKLNIEEGAELAKNNSKKETKKKKSNRNKGKNTIKANDANADDIIEESENKEKKFIELNLKLGVLDIVKKENSENKNKLLVEEIINDNNGGKNNIINNIKDSSSSSSDESSESDNSQKEKDDGNNIIRMQGNKVNKGKNYLEVLKRNDNILQSIISNKSKDSVNSGTNGMEEYPFLDFKNDSFNKKVLNFLMENSKNKQTKVESNNKKRRILSSKKTNINNNNNISDKI